MIGMLKGSVITMNQTKTGNEFVFMHSPSELQQTVQDGHFSGEFNLNDGSPQSAM